MYDYMSTLFNKTIYFAQYGEVPPVLVSAFPLLFAVCALYLGCKLLNRLKPGMVCRASLGCDRCELLYSIGLGSAGFSAIYIVLEAKWVVSGAYNQISSLDSILWSTLSAGVMFFLAWASYRSLHCLGTHCNYSSLSSCKGRQHLE